MSIRIVIGLAIAASGALAQADTYGRMEHVKVLGVTPIEVLAKLDSGADVSALHAVNVKYFTRNGDTWVRFTIDNGSVLPGNHVTLERPVLKDVRIKQKGGGTEHRPLVEVELCVGERIVKSRLSLSDRSGYTAPLLIGVSDLGQLGSVDVARQFTHEPACKPPDAIPAVATSGPKAGAHSAAAAAATSSVAPPSLRARSSRSSAMAGPSARRCTPARRQSSFRATARTRRWMATRTGCPAKSSGATERR